MSTMQATPQITFVTIENESDPSKTETATYFRNDEDGGWTLVTVETGPTTRLVSRDITRAQGIATRHARHIVHLRKGGEWQKAVPDYLMQESTPVQRIEAEIADLRAEAHRLAESAAYSGSHGSGAGLLTAKADAMQHVLDVLATDEN